MEIQKNDRHERLLFACFVTAKSWRLCLFVPSLLTHSQGLADTHGLRLRWRAKAKLRDALCVHTVEPNQCFGRILGVIKVCHHLVVG